MFAGSEQNIAELKKIGKQYYNATIFEDAIESSPFAALNVIHNTMLTEFWNSKMSILLQNLKSAFVKTVDLGCDNTLEVLSDTAILYSSPSNDYLILKIENPNPQIIVLETMRKSTIKTKQKNYDRTPTIEDYQKAGFDKDKLWKQGIHFFGDWRNDYFIMSYYCKKKECRPRENPITLLPRQHKFIFEMQFAIDDF